MINICDKDNGGCMHKCVHIAHKEFKCECKPGYELDGDKACISELFYAFSWSVDLSGWFATTNNHVVVR